MRFAQRLVLIVTVLTALSASVLASSPVGNWKGHVVIDTSKMQKVKDPKMQQMIDQGIAKAKSMVISLSIKADKTYTASASGSGAPADKDNGTWKLAGNTLTLTSLKKDSAQKPQAFTMSSDGKTLTLSLPSGQGASAKVIFKR